MAKTYDKDELIELIIRKAKLSTYEAEMFRHDINNLRGIEWLGTVKECAPEYYSAFKKLV